MYRCCFALVTEKMNVEIDTRHFCIDFQFNQNTPALFFTSYFIIITNAFYGRLCNVLCMSVDRQRNDNKNISFFLNTFTC